MKKTALFFGGRSAEHAVSIASAAHILPLLHCKGVDVFPVYIDRNGALYTFRAPHALHEDGVEPDALLPLSLCYTGSAPLSFRAPSLPPFTPERILSLLHGTYGEDGAWQGLFRLANLPFIGCGILASAITMHKPTAKDLAAHAGIPTLPYVCAQDPATAFSRAVCSLSYPMFVKPASGGSSLGASRASDHDSLRQALYRAFSYGEEVMIEPCVTSTELSVAIAEQNGKLTISPVGETVVRDGFYDYEAKYKSNNTAFLCPAPLDGEQTEKILQYAKTLFRLYRCRHMARVDFLKAEDGSIYFNEINTIPGFTAHSLYAKLLAAASFDALSLFTEASL